MLQDLFVSKIQRESCHSKCVQKVSELSRKRPLVGEIGLSATVMHQLLTTKLFILDKQSQCGRMQLSFWWHWCIALHCIGRLGVQVGQFWWMVSSFSTEISTTAAGKKALCLLLPNHILSPLCFKANVMLEYSIAEAEALLSKNLKAAQKNLAEIEEDLGFLRDQYTTTEVSILFVWGRDFIYLLIWVKCRTDCLGNRYSMVHWWMHLPSTTAAALKLWH